MRARCVPHGVCGALPAQPPWSRSPRNTTHPPPFPPRTHHTPPTRPHATAQSLYELQANSIINALVFSPNRYWLCAATNKNIIIWDLENKRQVSELPYPLADTIGEKALKPFATSLAWSSDGNTLYSGWTDKVIRVFTVSSS